MSLYGFSLSGGNFGSNLTNSVVNESSTSWALFVGGTDHSNISNNVMSVNGGYGVFHHTNANDNYYGNNTITGAEEGFYLGGARNTLSRNRIYGNSAYGVYIYNGNGHDLNDNNIYDNEGRGVDISSVNDIGLSRNVIYNNTDGIYVYDSYDVNITSTNSTNNSLNGLYVTDSNDIQVESNTVHNNSKQGMHFINSPFSKITNSNLYLNGENGMLANDSQGLNITDNLAYNNTYNGINIRNSSNANISSNRVENHTLDITGVSGYNIRNYHSNNTVISNNVLYKAVRSVATFYAHFTIIDNNTIWNNSMQGIRLAYGNLENVTNNVINTSEKSIFIYRHYGHANIINNTAYNATLDGVNCANTNFSIINNTFYGMRGSDGVGSGISWGYSPPPRDGFIEVINNTIYDSNTGISGSLVNNANIKGNTIHSIFDRWAPLGFYTNITSAIFIGWSNNVTIEDNLVYNITNRSMVLHDTNDSILRNNTIYQSETGIFLNMSHSNLIDDSVVYNNSDHGVLLVSSNGTTVNRSMLYSNNLSGLNISNSNDTTVNLNNITNNTLNGLLLDFSSTGTNLDSNYICWNDLVDLNSSGSGSGQYDHCDSFIGWSENGHKGCEYSCSELWHRFYGNASGNLTLKADGDADDENVKIWPDAPAYNIYFMDADSSINWDDLQAIGRNTSNENSTNDFEELDIAFETTGYSDNINNTFSIDGSVPKDTLNMSIYNREVDLVPVARSAWNSTFTTGILWDTSDGGTEYSNAINQSTVWVVRANSSISDTYGIYDYLGNIPAELSFYEGANDLVDIYVEIRD
jgi:parallel beta-helix repeat protein